MEPSRLASRWPVADLRDLAVSLKETITPCQSSHLCWNGYAICEAKKVEDTVNVVAAVRDEALERDFVTHIVALYRSLHSSSCVVIGNVYWPVCDRFKTRTISRLLHAPDSTLETEITALRRAFTNYNGTLLPPAGKALHYVMEWRRVGLVALTIGHVATEQEATWPLELLALRLHCIMQRQYLLAPPRKHEMRGEKSLSYNQTSTPHVAVAMESSSSWGWKGYNGSLSNTYGVLRLTLRPGAKDPGEHYFPFDLSYKDYFNPETLWRMRELLYTECTKRVDPFPITGLIAVCKALFSMIVINKDITFCPTNSETMNYLHTLLPLCLQKQIRETRGFADSLVALYQQETERQKQPVARFVIDNLFS